MIPDEEVGKYAGKTLYELATEVPLTEYDVERAAKLADKMASVMKEMEKLPSLYDGEHDPNGVAPNTPGAKLDAGKVMPWLFMSGFSNALEEVARVTTLGARKYTPNGWVAVPDGSNRYMEAFGRHTIELGKGKVFDDGPKGLGPDVYHKAQMIWNLLASLGLELREKNGKQSV